MLESDTNHRTSHQSTQYHLEARSKACETATMASWLVSWCFEPNQPQGITSGLNTDFSLSPIYSTSHYTTSLFFFSNHSSNSIHNFGTQNQKNNNTCFGAYLYSVNTQHGNLHPAGWPILLCGPTQEPVLACMAINWPTPGFKERAFKLCGNEGGGLGWARNSVV